MYPAVSLFTVLLLCLLWGGYVMRPTQKIVTTMDMPVFLETQSSRAKNDHK